MRAHNSHHYPPKPSPNHIEEKYMGLPLYLLDSKMADGIDNNLSLDEPQNENENENPDEELINELRTLVNDCDDVNGLVKIIEKYSK